MIILQFLLKLLASFWPFNKGRTLIHKLYFSVYKLRDRVIINNGRFSFYVDLSSFAGQHLYLFHRNYEEQEISFVNKYLKSDSVFLDIGANFGYYSLHVASMQNFNGRVLAFEALPSIFSDFMDNRKLNNLDNITAFNFGVSDKEEKLDIKIHPTNYGGSSFVKDLKGWKDVQIQTIPCNTLMSFLNKESIKKVDFIKIDIEGFEYKVLKKYFEDAINTSLMPNYILLEYHESLRNQAGGSSVELVVEFGYKLVQLDGINYYFEKNK